VFDPKEIPAMRESINEALRRDKYCLDELRAEIKALAANVGIIRPRSTTAVSMVASDGGNNQLVFDPFHLQIVRVVDSYGEQLCLDTVTPTTDTDLLSAQQFNPDGSPRTALGRMMADLSLKPLNISQLSHMVPKGEQVRANPYDISPTWVLVYRDLCEWAALYERICYRNFVSNTIVVRDGQLRSKLFRGENFIKLRKLIEASICDIWEKTKRKVYLVGIAKHSKVLEKYNLAMTLERLFAPGSPRYVKVPRSMEAKAYLWPEYARGAEVEGEEGEAPKFVAGDMYLVRFGEQSGDPIWPVDIFSSQSNSVDEILGYLLADAICGFPVPYYPLCLQKAHEYATIAGFDMDILQDEVFSAIRNLLNDLEIPSFEALRFRADYFDRRY
jgi:hypothetical protein